jgi:hypothetical protein
VVKSAKKIQKNPLEYIAIKSVVSEEKIFEKVYRQTTDAN